ncbi:putative low density lipoprotein receptor adapter protein 1 [Apostichopus japonicus]|uniref:Putative low density lipoprotein receptor adapter protein 1 n=2 Tax=Stichopus japonicus TaxID=307972 RepID=A0A2G8JKK3_STIJA|nr:putative low density lipoprotein receptor adapter protein 1 [Apostichopus japonicus]
MAKILRKKRKSISVDMNDDLPYFQVLFMGRIETEAKLDRDCTRVIVQHLVEKTRNEPLKPVRITITTRGLWVQEGPKFNPPRRETFVPIHNISYGSADKKYTKVFTFVTNFEDPMETKCKDRDFVPFYCYVFRCETQATTRAMVVYLLRAFKQAYLLWQKDVKKQEVKRRLAEGPRVSGDGDRRESDSNTESVGSSIDNQHTVHSALSTDDEFESMGKENTKLEKLSHYLERWVHQQKPIVQKTVSTDTEGLYELSKQERDASFRVRADRFSRPDILNCDVDIYNEMSDPDVQNVLQGVMKMNIAS